MFLVLPFPASPWQMEILLTALLLGFQGHLQCQIEAQETTRRRKFRSTMPFTCMVPRLGLHMLPLLCHPDPLPVTPVIKRRQTCRAPSGPRRETTRTGSAIHQQLLMWILFAPALHLPLLGHLFLPTWHPSDQLHLLLRLARPLSHKARRRRLSIEL